MNIEEFNYTLPEELIAQRPKDKRSDSRLLQINQTLKKLLIIILQIFYHSLIEMTSHI